jgi:hypothetical protein
MRWGTAKTIYTCNESDQLRWEVSLATACMRRVFLCPAVLATEVTRNRCIDFSGKKLPQGSSAHRGYGVQITGKVNTVRLWSLNHERTLGLKRQALGRLTR